MTKKQKAARRYEQTEARKHRGKHLGGPGRPDYTRGTTKGEVKNWRRPVDSGVIANAKKKGVKEIVGKSGFTEPAKEAAKKAGIKLIHRGRQVT